MSEFCPEFSDSCPNFCPSFMDLPHWDLNQTCHVFFLDWIADSIMLILSLQQVKPYSLVCHAWILLILWHDQYAALLAFSYFKHLVFQGCCSGNGIHQMQLLHQKLHRVVLTRDPLFPIGIKFASCSRFTRSNDHSVLVTLASYVAVL